MEGDAQWGNSAVSHRTFQSTPSAWRETQQLTSNNQTYSISIHSLRMEGDASGHGFQTHTIVFQSTPSAWRETGSIYCPWITGLVFQSTPSAWRETVFQCTSTICGTFQSTPSAWRETPVRWVAAPGRSGFQSTPSAWRETMLFLFFMFFLLISIHSLRMEGDFSDIMRTPANSDFNPLPPHGGRQLLAF